MNHTVIAPILLPAFTAVLLLFTARAPIRVHRAISIVSTLALLAIAARLVVEAGSGVHQVYTLGSWEAPFGIVLVLDRLSAYMVLLTAIVGLLPLLHAIGGWDARGRNYHALFHFQLMGLNGAFLTGDAFNLFVFFEILLIASYGLLLHGGGRERLRAGLHYVVLNLSGSALFLLALGILYGTLGTLNFADLAARVAAAGPGDAALIRSGALLLLVVFSVKAAVLPLYFWLPGAYGSASAPVAALFSIMTKVGVYAILRTFTLVFGAEGGVGADVALPLLLPAALVTLVVATLGAASSRNLRRTVAYLVIVSVGTMLAGVGLFNAEGISAAVYYMAHSTLIVAALFLIAEAIANQRGEAADRLAPAPAVRQPALLGILFFVAAVAVVGMPPLSGFVGKVLILRSAVETAFVVPVFAVVLGTSFLLIVVFGRAGSVLFWKTTSPVETRGSAGSGGMAGPGGPAAAAAGADPGAGGTPPPARTAIVPAATILALITALALAAGPVTRYADATAAQLLDPRAYIESVLGPEAAGVSAAPGPEGMSAARRAEKESAAREAAAMAAARGTERAEREVEGPERAEREVEGADRAAREAEGAGRAARAAEGAGRAAAGAGAP